MRMSDWSSDVCSSDLLLTVELDRRAGEETPRVTVKRLQPFAGLATTARMVIECAVDDPAVIRQLAELVAGARGGRGEIRVRAPLPDGGSATVLLGRDFLLDTEDRKSTRLNSSH